MRIYLLIAAIAGGVTWLVTPLIRHVAIHIGAVGEVRARDVHTIPTPRMGGLGMLIGFAFAMIYSSRIAFTTGLFENNNQEWVILAGAVLICLLGMADDLWDLDWMLKMAGQLLISVFVAWGGLQIISLPIGSLITASPSISVTITAILIVASINAVNFVDGLDGLAFGRQRLNSGSSLGISLGSLVEVVGKHFVSHALSPSSCLSAEYPQGQLAQTVVHAGDQCHQQQHEDKHGEGPEEQFLAGRSDDLAEFVDNLFDEQANAHEDVRLNGLLAVLRLRHNNPPLGLL